MLYMIAECDGVGYDLAKAGAEVINFFGKAFGAPKTLQSPAHHWIIYETKDFFYKLQIGSTSSSKSWEEINKCDSSTKSNGNKVYYKKAYISKNYDFKDLNVTSTWIKSLHDKYQNENPKYNDIWNNCQHYTTTLCGWLNGN